MATAIESLISSIMDFAASEGLKILGAIVLIIVGTKLIGLICKKIDNHSDRIKIDKSVGSFLRSAVKAVLYALLYISALLIIGVPSASFIAVLGSAGLAIGLALQGSLSNLAGSIMILLFHPYKVGDYIEVAGVSGTVSEISLFYTVLITVDNKRVTVPNGTTSNATVVDYSQELRRVDLDLSAAYGTDSEKVRAVLLKLCADDDKILKDPAPVVLMNKQADSSINFYLRAWCKGADYWDVYFSLTEGSYQAFNREGIEIPFPQVDVHMR